MFKYLSGDFVAEYNKTLEELRAVQKNIDEKYSKITDELIKLESKRLEAIISIPFSPGSKVRLIDQFISGVVVDCPVNFTVDKDDWDCNQLFGPGRFLPLTKESDEYVVTCDGDLRKVRVLIEADELSKDYGVENKIAEYWVDELELID